MTTYLQDHNRLFGALEEALSRDLVRISTEANGGRSILFVYPPKDEDQYICEAKRRLTTGYEFIDLRELFVEFVAAKGPEKLKQLYKFMGTEVFVSQNYKEGTFYHLLLTRIVETYQKGVSPVLIHTGVIYKMGFTNHNIMDEATILQFKKPLVIFYPASYNNQKLRFLNLQDANNYRCVMVV